MTSRLLIVGLVAAAFSLALAMPASAQIRLNDKGATGLAPSGGGSSGSGGAPAASSGDMIDGTDLKQMVAVLQEQGFQAKVDQSSDGEPRIRSATGGINFSILTYSCKKGSPEICSIDFYTYWRTADKPLALEKINEWNRQWRFLKAYNDNDNDLNLSINIELSGGGISKKNFVRLLERWTSMVAKFDKYRQE